MANKINNLESHVKYAELIGKLSLENLWNKPTYIVVEDGRIIKCSNDLEYIMFYISINKTDKVPIELYELVHDSKIAIERTERTLDDYGKMRVR